MAYIFAPLGGIFVATSVAYSIRHRVQTDSQALAQALSESKGVLDQLDQELIGGKGSSSKNKILPPSYVRSSRPSLAEEIKSRWNEHLTTFVKSAGEVQWDSVASSAYNRIRGVVDEKVIPAVSESTSSSTLSQVSGGATLREAVRKAAPVDPRLHQPNTHYMGQGVSLR